MRKPKTQAQLQREVDSFNEQFPVGAEVDYFEVVGSSEPRRLRTRTAAEILSGHTAVVWLEGKSGCVSCDHCFAPPATARVAAHALNTTTVADQESPNLTDNAPLPLMRAAFRTSVSDGRRYELRFKFGSLADMQAAEREWRAFTAQSEQP